MRPEKFKAMIFDIGRVLVRIDVAGAMADLAEGASLSPQELWSALEKDPHWGDWQEGRISPPEWHRHLTQRLGGTLSFQQFSEIWNRALLPEPILANSLLEGLSRRYSMAVLSNTDPLHMAHLEANFPFLRHFPRRIYSCRIGASKPAPVIYKEALRACGVRAEEALYTDDVPAYVEAAQRLGMVGIVFSSPEEFLAELRSRGLLDSAAD